MDKNQEFYKNKKEYQDACVPVRERMLNYLIKEKFLSEFSTEEEKLQVLENLGITQKLDTLQNLVDNKIDISQLGSYVTQTELLRRLNDLKPKNEKSKGYYSSYEDLIANNPANSFGDWAMKVLGLFINLENMVGNNLKLMIYLQIYPSMQNCLIYSYFKHYQFLELI